eukprot:3875473-Rhodomonas_salina.1
MVRVTPSEPVVIGYALPHQTHNVRPAAVLCPCSRHHTLQAHSHHRALFPPFKSLPSPLAPPPSSHSLPSFRCLSLSLRHNRRANP